jgi:hypothetical protein
VDGETGTLVDVGDVADLAAALVRYLTDREIALALYADVSTRETLRCLLEGARWLGDASLEEEPASGSGISRARSRLGARPLEELYREATGPVAVPGTPGAWYRGWRVMTLDGSTLDVSDSPANERAFWRPASVRGVNATGAFRQLRLVGLLENGTHAIMGAELGPRWTSENELAASILPRLTAEMLGLADRGLLGFDLWQVADATGRP